MPKSIEAHEFGGFFASISILNKVWNYGIDLIFPSVCEGCGRVDFRWCPVCLEELASQPLALQPIPSDELISLYATGIHEGKLQAAIQALKYSDSRDLAIPLGNRLVLAIQSLNWKIDTIIPVPLHTSRLQKRGYNQAYLLSQQVAQTMQIDCNISLLQRHRDTPHQVGLNASERRENVKDAFIAVPDGVADKSILIIDDVVTTGSTLNACAIALFSAGARQVYGLTVNHAR